MTIRGLVLILILAVSPGCAPLTVGTATAIWYSLQDDQWCKEARERPDLEAKLTEPEFKAYFEQTCGQTDQPKQGQ